MKKYFIAAMLLVILSVAAYAFMASSETQNAPVRKCPMCGMNSAKSPTEVKYGDVYLAGLACWGEYASANKVDLTKGSVIDYPTASAKTRKYVDLSKAYFVAVEKLKNSMPPYYAAFSNEVAAKGFAEENKSTVVRFAEVSPLLVEDGSKGDCCPKDSSTTSHHSSEDNGKCKSEGKCGSCESEDKGACPKDGAKKDGDCKKDGAGKDEACPKDGSKKDGDCKKDGAGNGEACSKDGSKDKSHCSKDGAKKNT